MLCLDLTSLNLKLQFFHLDARKAVFHIFFCDSKLFSHPPATVEDYMTSRSSKIDAIVDIVKYHKQAPGRLPLAVKQQPATDDPGRLNTFESTVWDNLSSHSLTHSDSPDKIVLFVVFPEHSPFLKAVSQSLFSRIPSFLIQDL